MKFQSLPTSAQNWLKHCFTEEEGSYSISDTEGDITYEILGSEFEIDDVWEGYFFEDAEDHRWLKDLVTIGPCDGCDILCINTKKYTVGLMPCNSIDPNDWIHLYTLNQLIALKTTYA